MASTSTQGEQPISSLPNPSTGPTGSPKDVHRRIFIGPMPEKVIAHTEGQGKKAKLTVGSVLSFNFDNNNEPGKADKTEEVTRILKENAFKFFLHHGGKPEEWDDDEEHNLVEQMSTAWKESEWGQLWSRRHHRRKNDPQSANSRWFGKSFEVGNLLGINIMEKGGHLINKSMQTSNKPVTSKVSQVDTEVLSTTVPRSPSGQETFATPRSSFLGVVSTQDDIQSREAESPLLTEGTEHDPSPTSSRTGLLLKTRADTTSSGTPQRTLEIVPESQKVPQSSFDVDFKGKARIVHYGDDLDGSNPTPTPGPVPPEAVLQRTKDTVEPNTSLAATFISEQSPDSTEDLVWGDVVLRDRMLVRVSYTKAEGLVHFDDAINRTTRNLHYEDWGEFLVAWRRDSIEIYRDHGTPGKEWASGHKHLSYIVSLKSSRTRLSLYSFADLTFCLTCAPTTTRLNATTSRWIFSREKEGTNIFVFKLKSRSRAYDWTWQLWRHMGGQIPKTIDIHNPRLSTKVAIDVPESVGLDSAALYTMFKRENVMGLCMSLLRTVPDWKYLVEGHIKKGKSLELAWRQNANMDWVWLENDVSGTPRGWAVLCGLPFIKASRPPVLEIRLADHSPTHIHLSNGRRLDEPPAIEGYLDRIRPNTQTKQQTYIAIHHGSLFILNTASAFPPMPPGLTPVANAYPDSQTLRHTEIRRGTNQIINAVGVCDLRTIIAVRRGSHPTSASMHAEKEQNHEDSSWFRTWELPESRTEQDEGDEGGDGGLSKANDRTHLKVRRSFELLLNTGHIVRFEAYSCTVAIEWVERLRALVFYWKNRHRNDAKQEIELAQAQRPRLTPQTRVCHDDHEIPPEAPEGPSSPYAAIDNLFNWCVLEGCRPIVKAGRLYMKKGLHGQYKLIQLFVVAGHLVRFRIGSHSSMYPAMHKKINLLDAYVCSGYFAAQALPAGQYMPNASSAPRRYQDGLETDDREEDMLFMIWYRSHPQMDDANQDPTTTPHNTKSVPSLSAKSKMLVFKTRSVHERDSWCWALNAEIEKIVRAQKEREDKLRATGNLVKLAC